MTFAFGTEQKVLTLEFDGEASVKLSSLKGVHEIESLKHHSPSEIHRTETDNAARSEPNAPHVLQPDTNSSGEDERKTPQTDIVEPSQPVDCEEVYFLMGGMVARDANPLTPEELEALPQEYHDLKAVFSKADSERLPEHRPYDIGIDMVPGSKPPFGPIYNLNTQELATLKQYIDESLTKGHIRMSKASCGAPVLFVKKKDGSLRLCVDYRSLNAITVKDKYPLPLIDNLIERLSQAKVFTALDLRGAYNLVRVREGDEWKTSFRTRYGQFEYLVMPFGLTNAPAVFQRLMNDVFRELLDDFVVIYLDDLLIFSRSHEEHVKHVRKVLQILLNNDLYCKFSKCEFHRDSVAFLGYVVSSAGLSMNMQKVACILAWDPPKTRTALQSFLGFANYYRRFIAGYSKMVKPLTSLTKRDSVYKWTEEAQAAFENVKQSFTSAPLLRHADMTKPFVLETDASQFAMGGVLSQRDESGKLLPVAFYSSQLKGSELNWPIHDKELYAIVSAFRVWRHYLKGTPHTTTVYSDHRNLSYFMAKNLVNDRHIRWSMELSDANFVINYRPGTTMGKADALSRRDELKPIDENRKVLQLLPASKIGNANLEPKISYEFAAMHSSSCGAFSLESRTRLLSEIAKCHDVFVYKINLKG
jgi:hypothetical protein